MQHSYVYILFNRRNGTLYVGVTSDLKKRISEHRHLLHPTAFTARYQVTKLGYYETFTDITRAIAREKQLKAGSRAKKIQLIKSVNPDWHDLSEDWE